MNSSEIRSRLAGNLAAVEARIAAACARVARPRDEVRLIAVTKYVDIDVAAMLLDLGVRDLGESRPQELWRKAAALPKDVRWHLIGHLQRNKVERTLPLAYLIHSVDSSRLLDTIHMKALTTTEAGQAYPKKVLLEFNLSRESAKHGFSPEDHEALTRVTEIEGYDDGIEILGLMTMAAESSNAEQARSTFAALRNLRDEIPRMLPSPAWVCLRELSMGMTHDFEVAIEEGATMVRIGSALFEGLTPAL